MADIGLKIGLEGEKQFKTALSEINQSFKLLGSEMQLVASQFDKNDKSMEAVTARNEVLNKEIETQKQKIETLKQALDNASNSFGENDKRTQSWQIQLNNAQAALNTMERELDANNKALEEASQEFDEAEEAADDFGDEIKETANDADEAGGKFEKFGSVLKSVGKALTVTVAAIGTAAVAAGKKLWDMSNDVASAGDVIDKTSQKIGISAESYQKWDYVFQRCGADVNNLQTGMKKLAGVITDAADGSDSAAQKLSAVGLSIEDLNGKSQDEQLSIVISALQKMESGAARTSAANDLLGKSAVDMAAVLNMTAEETEALKQEAQDYGMVMSNEAVAASAAFEDSLTKMQGTMGGLKNRMVGDLLPGITMILDGLSDLVAGNEKAGEELTNGVTSIIETVTEMIPQAVEIISQIAAAVLENAPAIIHALAEGVIRALPTLLPVVLQVITELVTALLELLPQIVEAGMQILASLITGIATALPTLIPQIVEIIVQIVQTLVDNLPLILDAALQIITGLAEGLLKAIPVLIEALPELIRSIVDFVIGAIPQLIDAGIQLLTSIVTALPKIIESIVAVLPELIDAVITGILDGLPLIIEAGVTLFIALVENLPLIIQEIVKAVPKILESLIKALADGIPKMAEIGGNLVKGLWDGIKQLKDWLWDKVSGWISGIWDGICDFFGIHSPSKEMAWIGEMLVDGLAGSLDKNGKDAVKSAEAMADDINGVMQDMAVDLQHSIPSKIDMNTTLNGLESITPATSMQSFNVTIPLSINGITLSRILAEIQWTQNAVYVRNLGTV